MVSSGAGKSSLRWILGVGFWVQGFRCFPWMAVNFFLKDGLRVDPSTLQLLQNSANIPMVGKPVYGVVSDAVYISGQHRIPYLAIGAFLQAVSWLAIAVLPPSSTSIITISLFLLLSNLGASVVEVANDALVTESENQLSSTSKKSDSSSSSSSGQLQSFAWMSGSIGGILGNLIGGAAISRFSPRAMFLAFGLILVLQFFTTITFNENALNLPKNPSHGIRKQLSDLSVALQRPEIALSIMWFAVSYAVIPVLMGTMFFYQTQQLGLNSSVIGLSKVFGQAAMLLWSAMYNRQLKLIHPRKLLAAVQVTLAIFMASDALFVKGIYLKMGLPDSVYVVIFSGLQEVLFLFKLLPFSVLMAKLCPPGCEGSLMAFLMSTFALATIVSGYLGVALASYVGISERDFSGLPTAVIIQAVCTLVPLFLTSWIPDEIEAKEKKAS
ncbi:hypothetical protein Sjap_004009 [Stephania japonica]|uniref:Folate-biopterin transporter 7 n=1 Tax=Stephania japonica TaxID=461633 RepID=A0AAP0K1I1_9MAGN